MPSPDCQVKEGAGSFTSTVGGVDVAAGASISIRLASITSIDEWRLEIIGTDELSTPPTLTNVDSGTHIVTSPATVVTATFPNGFGRALGFKTTIVSGISTLDGTFSVYSLTDRGFRVGFGGETLEGDPVFGWGSKLNRFIRTGAGTPSLSGVRFSTLTESPIGTEAWVQLTGDMVLPAFLAELTPTVSLVEVGSTSTTPAFTATYTTSPGTVTLTDTEGTSPKNVSGTPGSFTSNGVFTKNTYGATVGFTITAVKGSVTATSTENVTWGQNVYWGLSSSTGPFNAAFITGLSNSELALSTVRDIHLVAGPGQKTFYAVRSAYPTPVFSSGGIIGGVGRVASNVSLTNGSGFTENYDVWATNQAALGDMVLHST